MSAAMMRFDHVGMAYGSPARPVLDGITLEIRQGEFVCVLGQTGCGKSTLLRLLLGAERPTNGRVLIDGREHRHPDRSRGYVPQRYSLFPTRRSSPTSFGPRSAVQSLARWTPNSIAAAASCALSRSEHLRKPGLREADA
jgi:NitT/TauT family transport system ATP-binding protein